MYKILIVFCFVIFITMTSAFTKSAEEYLTERATILMLEDQRSLGDGKLVKLLRDHENPSVRQRAALALARIQDKETAPDLISALQTDLEENVKRDAAFALGQIRDSSAVQPLIDYLNSEGLHWETIDALGKIGTDPAFFALFQLLSDPKISKKRAQDVMRVIWKFKKGSVVPLVTRYAKNNDIQTRRIAIYCLMRLRDPSANDILFKLIEDKDSYIRSLAVAGLQSIGKLENLKKLKKLLKDEDYQVQINAIRALRRLGFANILKIDQILELTEKGDTNVRVTAIDFLGDIGNEAAVPYLVSYLNDSNVRVEQAAILAIGKLIPKKAPNFLASFASHPDWRLRDATAEAFQQIEGDDTTQLLMAMAEDSNPMVQATILTALSQRQPQGFADIIAERLDHPDPLVRTIALGISAEFPELADSLRLTSILEKKYADPIWRDVDFLRETVDVLAKLNADSTFSLLKKMTKDENYIVRRQAADRLFELTGDRVEIAPVQTGKSLIDYENLLAANKDSRGVRADIITTRGTIRLQLFPEEACLTVHNFVTLAQKGYYDGVNFHRVAQNFVIQAGCPLGNGWGGPGYTIRCEINHRHCERGAVGMALSGKDTGGSQFFITHSPQYHLDGGYTIFGEVVEGMDTVDQIVQYDIIETIKIKFLD